eukprot:761408-Hanusia_phi.AAC.5
MALAACSHITSWARNRHRSLPHLHQVVLNCTVKSVFPACKSSSGLQSSSTFTEASHFFQQTAAENPSCSLAGFIGYRSAGTNDSLHLIEPLMHVSLPSSAQTQERTYQGTSSIAAASAARGHAARQSHRHGSIGVALVPAQP